MQEGGLITPKSLDSEQCLENLQDQGGVPGTQFIVDEDELNARPELLEAQASWEHYADLLHREKVAARERFPHDAT